MTARPPVPRPGKIICIGLNYRDHAEGKRHAESRRRRSFSRNSQPALSASEDPILLPAGSEQVDYEAELAVRHRPHVPKTLKLRDAMRSRLRLHEFQRCFGTRFAVRRRAVAARKIVRHVCADGRVRRDNRRDRRPAQSRIRFRLNGETMQDSNTRSADLQDSRTDRVSFAYDHARTRRHHRDRHAAGCRICTQAADISKRRRHLRGRDRGPRHSVESG